MLSPLPMCFPTFFRAVYPSQIFPWREDTREGCWMTRITQNMLAVLCNISSTVTTPKKLQALPSNTSREFHLRHNISPILILCWRDVKFCKYRCNYNPNTSESEILSWTDSCHLLTIPNQIHCKTSYLRPNPNCPTGIGSPAPPSEPGRKRSGLNVKGSL